MKPSGGFYGFGDGELFCLIDKIDQLRREQVIFDFHSLVDPLQIASQGFGGADTVLFRQPAEEPFYFFSVMELFVRVIQGLVGQFLLKI